MPQCWSISQACTLWYLDRDRLDRERASKLYHVPWALILERSSFNYFGCIDWIRLSFPSHVLWMEVQDGTWIDIGVLVRFWLILLRRHLRTCGGLSPRTRFLHEVINMMTSCRRRACFAFRQLRNQSFLDSVISLPSFCYLVLIGLSAFIQVTYHNPDKEFQNAWEKLWNTATNVANEYCLLWLGMFGKLLRYCLIVPAIYAAASHHNIFHSSAWHASGPTQTICVRNGSRLLLSIH